MGNSKSATAIVVDNLEKKRLKLVAGNKEGGVSKPSTYSSNISEQPSRNPVALFLFAIVIAVLIFGWHISSEEYITAETGIGYRLGIIGSIMMLLLLVYPVCKKNGFLARKGLIRHIFRIHIFLGITGPLLILFHANFRMGSINSRVVLFSMLTVVGSGLIGLFIYRKIHYGLFGRLKNLVELQKEIEIKRDGLGAVSMYAPSLKDRLLLFEDSIAKEDVGLIKSLCDFFIVGIRVMFIRLSLSFALRRALRVTARRRRWSHRMESMQREICRRQIACHIRAVYNLVEFRFYERVFSLWHIFHLPLFIMLIISAVVHVIAVHMY